MNEKNKEIGNLLKTKRKELGYSLEDIKLILKKDFNIELDSSNISRYENGTVKNMNAAYLRALCKANNINYVSVFKELGYIDPDDKRIDGLDKKGMTQYEKAMNEAVMFFNDERIEEEDKQKLMLALNEIFFRSKEINKEKYKKKNKEDLKSKN